MARMKNRGRLVGDVHWLDRHHEVAIRMYQRDKYLKIREAVARLGIINHHDPTSHLLNTRNFRVNERDRQGRISSFFGFTLLKEIDGVLYDLVIEAEDDNDDCLRLVLREHRQLRDVPDDRFFIIHKDRRDNADAIEAVLFPGFFLKVDPQSDRLCMVKAPRDLFRVSNRRVRGFHEHYKFEIIFDPPSVPFLYPDVNTDSEPKEVIDPEEPNVIHHRDTLFNRQRNRIKGAFGRFVRFVACGYKK